MNAVTPVAPWGPLLEVPEPDDVALSRMRLVWAMLAVVSEAGRDGIDTAGASRVLLARHGVGREPFDLAKRVALTRCWLRQHDHRGWRSRMVLELTDEGHMMAPRWRPYLRGGRGSRRMMATRSDDRQLDLFDSMLRVGLPVVVRPDIPRAQSNDGRLARELLHWPVADFGCQEGAHLALPQLMQEIADVIGRRKALELSDAIAGAREGRRRVYVPRPRNLGPEHLLARILGIEVAREFAEVFHHAELDVPTCRDLRMAHRDAAISRMWRAGASPTRIRRITRADRKTVAAVIARDAPGARLKALPHPDGAKNGEG